jgi:hypothetical protein
MRISYWIPKAIDTLSENVTRTAFPRQQWLGERASMLRLYVHCLSYSLVYVLCKKCIIVSDSIQMEACPLPRLTERKKRERQNKKDQGGGGYNEELYVYY